MDNGELTTLGNTTIRSDGSVVYTARSVQDTYSIARAIAAALKGGEVLLLTGGLGAGKTTFTKGLAAALGITRNVVSPTFTLVREYDARDGLKLFHFDLYRIEDEAELEEIGVEEYFRNDAIVVIEWNKIAELGGKVKELTFTVADDGSRIIEVKDR